MNQNHPSVEQISSLFSEKNKEVQHHVLACQLCKKIYQGFTKTMQTLKSMDFERVNLDEGHLSDEQLSAYVQNNLDEMTVKSVKHHLNHCENCLMMVLNIRAHRAAAKHKTHQLTMLPFLLNFKKSLLALLGKNEWRTPVWMTAATTSVIFIFSLIMLRLLPTTGLPATHIALYQDDAAIYYYDSQPHQNSLSFMGEAALKKEPFFGMNIQWHKNALKLSWLPLPDVSHYTLGLFAIEADKTVKIAEQRTQLQEAYFKELQLLPGKRYEWWLSGLKQGMLFKIKGGFVVN